MGKEQENMDTSDDENTPQKEVKPEVLDSEEEEDLEVEKVDNLRKVIKLQDKNNEEKPNDSELEYKENPEQKRMILQSIKDFDFLIKKNQDEITAVNKKLESVTKDLDDLISLYEIVSEQMNPFVGLSKVTKKRIDALENFTKEIDDLKNRLDDIESIAAKSGIDIKSIGMSKKEAPAKINDMDSQDYLDEVIEKSIRMLNIDCQMDRIIDEFIENLKA